MKDAITALTAQVTATVTAIQNATTDIQTLVNEVGDPTTINNLTAQLKTATDALNAVLNPSTQA